MNNTDTRLEELAKKGKVIKPFNPFDSKKSYGCPDRLCINTYSGCAHKCSYCYNHWSKNSLHPNIKKDFQKNFERDLRLIEAFNLQNLLVSISNSTDPFQYALETQYKHTLFALRLLNEKKMKVLILTKNPSVLLSPEYLNALDIKNTVIQVSIAFLDKREDIEPLAPSPTKRIKAVRELVCLGYKTCVRVDPIIPNINSFGQSKVELENLISALADAKVKHIISKTLKLVGAVKKVNPVFYDTLVPYYRANGYWRKNCFMLNEDAKTKLLQPVYKEVVKAGMTFFTCYELLNFPGAYSCDGAESMVGICHKG